MEARYQLRQSPLLSCDCESLTDTWPEGKIGGRPGQTNKISALGVVAHDWFREGTGVPFFDPPAAVAAGQ